MGLFATLFRRRAAPDASRQASPAEAHPTQDELAAGRAVLEKLEPWKRARTRAAWLPQVEVGSGAPAGSRFGGLPWLPEGASHPRCGHCEAPLRLLLQLDLGALPPQAQLGQGLLQAFYCEHSDCEVECEGWSPFSKAHHVRVVEPGPGSVAAPTGEPFPPRAIAGWEQREDLPSSAEHRDQGLAFDYDFEAKTVRVRCAEVGLDSGPLWRDALQAEQVSSAAPGDKLLGWPDWVQGVEYPACPRCARQMELVFQLGSEDHLPHMWGDAGVAHVTRCPEHPDVLTMAWACG